MAGCELVRIGFWSSELALGGAEVRRLSMAIERGLARGEPSDELLRDEDVRGDNGACPREEWRGTSMGDGAGARRLRSTSWKVCSSRSVGLAWGERPRRSDVGA